MAEAEDIVYRVLRPGPAALFVVRVSVPDRPGLLWASRLPGTHVPLTEMDVLALVEAGITRLFCLVPTFAVNGLHGAYRYLEAAARHFGDRFHQIEILDHEVPSDDVAFEAQVAVADEALARGEHILVHCVGGCGRTGIFAACAMVRGGLAPRAAIAHFRAHRRCGPETAEQIAYVVRYARRIAPRPALARPPPAQALPVLRISKDAGGQPIQLAKGGLAVIQIGRLRIPGHRWRRVAVKRFVYPVDDVVAVRMQRTVEDLAAAGVRLPKMAMHRMDDGTWVQVAQLFGSLSRGSKFVQPSGFHKTLSRRDRDFAVDQLTRVANAGYVPSLDLFLVFEAPDKGIVPIDLDLVLPGADPSRLAAELVKRMIQIGVDEGDRDRLLTISIPLLRPDLAVAVQSLLSVHDGPYARLWRAF
jgi:protein-tyrosine phosphatase